MEYQFYPFLSFVTSPVAALTQSFSILSHHLCILLNKILRSINWHIYTLPFLYGFCGSWRSHFLSLHFYICCGLTPTNHQLLLTPPPAGKNQRIKAREPMGWDKDNLIGKAKAVHKSKVKGGICCFPWVGRCLAFSRRAGHLGRQTLSLQKPLFSSFFPPLYILNMMSYCLEYPFGQLGSPILAVFPLNLPCTPNFLICVAVGKAAEALALC